ncbi:MAG: MFS transporter [Phycisphaerae bacterium]
MNDRLYTSRFFQVFGAVVLFMTGVALQFHFGQYVAFVGYGVDTLGQILSVSMIGTLLIRLQLGRWIDRFGCRPTWIVGAMVQAFCVGAMQIVTHVWAIAALRSVSVMATAAVMTTVAVFAAQVAPAHRRAESIGTMGLAGFTGMIIGPTLGDWIFSGSTETITPYRVFFTASAACSLLSALVIHLAVLPSAAPIAVEHGLGRAAPAQGGASRRRLIREHWPGAVLVVGVAFSMVFCLQISFLERLAEERGFKNIKVFFLVYAPTAMTLRILFRRVPEQFGRSRTVVAGLVLEAVGLCLLVGIGEEGQLVWPALLMGAGHCFIFPSMVDLAAERFPAQLRGTGTALILAAGDVGMLIGFAGLGELIDRRGFDTALYALAITLVTAATFFAAARRDAVFRRGFGRGRQGGGR